MDTAKLDVSLTYNSLNPNDEYISSDKFTPGELTLDSTYLLVLKDKESYNDQNAVVNIYKSTFTVPDKQISQDVYLLVSVDEVASAEEKLYKDDYHSFDYLPCRTNADKAKLVEEYVNAKKDKYEIIEVK